IPVGLSKFRGVLVRTASRPFVIPTANVLRVARVARSEIRTVEQRETIRLDGEAVSLVRLADVLGIPPTRRPEETEEFVRIVVLGSAESRIAFLVDEILSEEEVLVKGLGKQLSRVRNIAGVSMTRTAGIVPILFIPDLMDSAIRTSAAGAAVPAPAKRENRRRSILVVEDSITSRTLLKNILESAGYDVGTAVDGVDGLTRLRSGKFDLVVSDVDMPRMTGLDLTAKIRGDRKLGELPVVLVTALESREDRERGIDVGANAYLLKSQFHQSNLLETVERLL
ncbi:MAG: response regulator, partial [bacterium]|nr:response regulator [bacterium]